MRKIVGRSTILTAACAPIAAMAMLAPAASAEPLDCQNGQWWNPVSNVCRPLGQV
ncbi:hypothetical protein [Mycolicibacterium sp.]|uniref:hypothetical protein n=1 Tax=Mycolicibacterium sp. TaxID=2320850 RepID=UPI0037CA410E